MDRRCTAVILAAGEGTRMRSAVPKPLHAVAGRSMLAHVAVAALACGASATAVVVGPDRADVAAEAERVAPGTTIAVQRERRGTAHAVLAARNALARGDDVLVLYADVPLIRPETLSRLRDEVAGGAAVAVLGFRAADPTGYGRLLVGPDGLRAIREHKDATPTERDVTLCNAGLMAIDGALVLPLLDAVGTANAQGEFYLTDVVEIARGRGCRCVAVETGEDEVMGVNDRIQLAAAEAAIQRRLREAAMRAGATLVAPETVFLSTDTRLGRDVTVEPHCVFGPGVVVGDGRRVAAFSRLESVTLT